MRKIIYKILNFSEKHIKILHFRIFILALFMGTFIFAGIAKAVCQVTIGADPKYAGAISSLVCNGKQFIDNFDHGRQLQTAVIYGNNPPLNLWGCDNPTEAGSYYDFSGPTSESSLLEFSQTSNTLHTKTQMANWLVRGRGTDNDIGCMADKVVPGVQPSTTVMDKTVTINGNVISFNVNVSLDPTKTLFAIATGAYLTSDFTNTWTYNTGSHQWQSGATQSGDPKILSTADGSYALGVVPPSGWSATAVGTGGFGNITIFTRAASYTSTFIAGTLDEVKAGIIAIVDPTRIPPTWSISNFNPSLAIINQQTQANGTIDREDLVATANHVLQCSDVANAGLPGDSGTFGYIPTNIGSKTCPLTVYTSEGTGSCIGTVPVNATFTPVNGVCSATRYTCVPGTITNNV